MIHPLTLTMFIIWHGNLINASKVIYILPCEGGQFATVVMEGGEAFRVPLTSPDSMTNLGTILNKALSNK